VSPPTRQFARFWQHAMACRECPTLAPWRKFDPAARGNPAAGVIILGEAPGRVSLDNQRPFSNPPESFIYFTDAVKCWPSAPSGANRSPTAREAATCARLHLRRELTLLRPRVIFAFGVRAATALFERPLRLSENHARPLDHPAGYRVIPLMHPSTINIAGFHRVGLRSLDHYEAQLTELFRREFARLAVQRLLPLTTPTDTTRGADL
jgi:uracil-DNA glycosylase